MAQYVYYARDNKGEDHRGDILSADPHTAAALLRKKGLVIISIQVKKPPLSEVVDNFINRVKFDDLVVLTRQLATMISAGLVLSEAIDILQEQQPNKILKQTLTEISQDIKGGLTLAQAMSRHKEIFPHLYVNLIKSGEASGKLDVVLKQMADQLEKDREFRSKIKGAMIYPTVVVTMMVAVMIIMMIFVVPKLTSLYSQSTIDLPLPTKILIGTSSFMVNFWWVMLIGIVLAVLGFRRWVKTPEGNLLYGRILLKLPIVGRVVTDVTLTNFNRTFGMLTSAGIPILESISIVEDQTENPVFKGSLKEAYLGVEKGLPFSSLLNKSIFPRIVGQMIRVGEETGKVDEIFFKLADYFESESDNMLKNLTVAIEPIILIILGIGVGFLVLSIILPIYKLTTSF